MHCAIRRCSRWEELLARHPESRQGAHCREMRKRDAVWTSCTVVHDIASLSDRQRPPLCLAIRFNVDNIDVVRTRLPTGSSKHNDNGKGPVLAPTRGGQPLNSPPPAQLRSPNNATQVKRFFTCKLRLPNSRPATQLATSSKAGLERTTDIFPPGAVCPKLRSASRGLL